MDSRGEVRKSGDTVNWNPERADRGRAAGPKGRGLPSSVGGASRHTFIHGIAEYLGIVCSTFSVM